MTSKTITDRAGDTLRLSTGSLTAGPGEITIKVNERFRGVEAVAAVHVDPAALRAALDEVAPLGKYTRTTPGPDDMDGGVAAALIEREAEDTLSLVQQQRDQAIGRVNTLSDENDDLRARAEEAERERDEARRHECSDLDAHWRLGEALASLKEANATVASLRAAGPRPLTPDAPECDRHIAHIATQDRVLRHRNRTIRDLTQERDEARATKDMHKRRADGERARAEKVEKERDAAQHVLEEHRCGEQAERAYRRAVAVESRPLTPDAMTAREHLEAAMKGGLTREDIPNDMCDRLVASRADTVRRPTAPGDEYPRRGVRDDLLAALTEPPARPAGAEDLQRAMADLEMDDPAGFADLLAERNIRVVGEDGAA